MKKESFDKKCDRVYKELTSILKSGKEITALTEDQRHILIANFGNEEMKYMSFIIGNNIYLEDVIDDGIRDNKNDLLKLFEVALNKCEQYAIKNNLVYISYGIDYDGCNNMAVGGYTNQSDKDLIDCFTKVYKKEMKYEEERKKHIQQQKQLEKQLEKKNKSKQNAKTINIDGKTYKLVE